MAFISKKARSLPPHAIFAQVDRSEKLRTIASQLFKM